MNLSSFFILILSFSCAHTEQSRKEMENDPIPLDQEPEEVFAPQTVGPFTPDLSSIEFPEIENEIDEANNQLEQNASKHKIPVEFNEGVKKWIHYFTHQGRGHYQRYLDRGIFYRPMISQVLKYENMPDNLYYLAMIESGFTVTARSHASAVGLWQFIRGTGTRYGLKINHLQDDRRDPIRSTQAAAKYLKDLYNVFNSWHLALAAYNAGEGRIVGAIMRGKSRDFWELVEKRVLPKETMDYVPKFMAAAIIGEHPDKYGFKINRKIQFPEVKLVKVPERIPLHKIAEKTNTNIRWLKFLNPHLIRGVSSSSPLWVPSGEADNIANNFQEFLSHQEHQVTYSTPEPSYNMNTHQVRSGESIASISRRFRVSSSAIKKVNNLRSSKLWVGQKIKIPGKHESSQSKRAETSTSPSSTFVVYHVSKGDNLQNIAQMTNLSMDKLKKINRLKSGEIYSGQKIKLPLSYRIYKVRKGDNLTDISNRFNVPMKLLTSLNRIDKKPIYPGQRLKIINSNS